MSARRYVSISFFAICVALPVVIGTSCPPPSRPVYLTFTTTDESPRVLPSCTSGFICINFTNRTIVPVQLTLHYHDGFDELLQYADAPSLECCANPNSIAACPCPCNGYKTGECRLTRPAIFDIRNRKTINGFAVITLDPGELALERVQCGDVKTIGVATALVGKNINLDPDHQEGPVYRSTLNDIAFPGEVPCGETVEFIVVDLNDSADPALVTIAIRVDISG